jgi:hypothetical protein
VKIAVDKLDFLDNADRVNTMLKASPKSYIGAVIFDDFLTGADDLPKNISYTIRYPVNKYVS